MIPKPVSDSACRQIYVLSLWREAPGAPWRAALRPTDDQQRIGFADLEALALFLLRLDNDREISGEGALHAFAASGVARPAGDDEHVS